MSWERVATVDEVHAEVVREALADAGIEGRIVPLKPLQQLQAQQLVSRPMVDVEVPAERREEALAVLAQFEASGEAAALEQAEAALPVDEARQQGSLWKRGWRWLTGHGEKDDGSRS